MVTVTNAMESTNTDSGETFVSLELSGQPELVTSKDDNSYMTSRKTYLTTTYSLAFAQSLIGSKLPGSIKKVECEPYEYLVKSTGKTIELSHTYSYSPVEEDTGISKEPNVMTFSKNGEGAKELVTE